MIECQNHEQAENSIPLKLRFAGVIIKKSVYPFKPQFYYTKRAAVGINYMGVFA